MSQEDQKLCREIFVQLPALVAGELGEEARRSLEQHLSFCSGCQFEWRAHELIWRCLADCEDVDPPAELRQRVIDAIETHDRALPM